MTLTGSACSSQGDHVIEEGAGTLWDRLSNVGIGAAIVCQVALLTLVGFVNVNAINPDAVAYLLLASHYERGDFGLAVSGYWSPLLSWVLVPLVERVPDPLIAARIAMGFSAVVFLLGSVSLFKRLQLPPVARVMAAWIVSIASVSWSVANITPDLLMGGLLCLALARILPPTWLESRRTQFVAGLLCAAAYLAKAAALPVSILVLLTTAMLRIVTGQANPRNAVRAVAVTLLGVVVLAGPWIMTLSLKYGTFVVSTSARANHAIVGPPDMPRARPDVFEKPEAGRIYSGEDLTFAQYNHWSPFESWSYFKHQLRLGYHNSARIVDFVAGFDRLHIGLVAALFGLLIHVPWRMNLASEPWRLSALPILAAVAVYAPVYAGDERYYYAMYPFVVAAALAIVMSLTRTGTERMKASRWLGMAVVVVSFVMVPATQFAQAVAGHDDEISTTSKAVARSLKASGFNGAIAAAGDCGGTNELYAYYLAFFIQKPFYGCEEMPSEARVRETGASLILVHGELTSLSEAMENDRTFENVDSIAFGSVNPETPVPIKSYRVREP